MKQNSLPRHSPSIAAVVQREHTRQAHKCQAKRSSRCNDTSHAIPPPLLSSQPTHKPSSSRPALSPTSSSTAIARLNPPHLPPSIKTKPRQLTATPQPHLIPGELANCRQSHFPPPHPSEQCHQPPSSMIQHRQ
jgi:hypothetical protein